MRLGVLARVLASAALGGCFYQPKGVEPGNSTGPADTTGTGTSTVAGTSEGAPTSSGPETSSSSSGAGTTTSGPNTETGTTGPQTPATTSEPETMTVTTGASETSSTGTGDTDDTSGTTMTGPMCGNNIREDGEACDGTDLNGQTCKTVIQNKWGGGVLACSATCESFDDEDCCLGLDSPCKPVNPLCCGGLQCKGVGPSDYYCMLD